MSATNGTHQEQAPAAASEPAPATPSKDEIGWYFVESYYTTLSKTPEKLHLFYNGRSQYVTGDEGQTSVVSVGRAAIKERIASRDFADCKVRVSNVDSQSTDNEMIVVQVIGETSNKTSELKKFVQTFVLARQPGGYYVQNDIFRYIVDELEEATTEAIAVAKEAAPVADEVTETVEEPKIEAVEEPQAPAIDAETVDKKLEQDPKPAILKAQETNGDVEAVEAEKEEAPAKAEEVQVEEKEAEKEALVPEVPQDPTPTPVLAKSPPKPAPVAPAAPAKPMSWASRAAAAAVAMPRPVVPVVPAPKAAAPARAPARAPAQAAAAAAKVAPSPVQKENEAPQSQGWQTAGAGDRRQNRPQSMSAQSSNSGAMGYVRDVVATVDENALRQALEKFGELVYFDVNRTKNCAFIEYASPAGYQAAAAANPHKVGDELVTVDPRKPRSAGMAGNFNNNRGGMNNRGGRGAFQNRGPGHQNGRGNFGGPARGGPQQRAPRAPAPAAAQSSA